MPRVALNLEQKKDYKLKDFKGWVHKQMKLKEKKQQDVADALGISKGRVSQMLKNYDPKKAKGKRGEKDPFSYGQVLILCELFDADEEERKKLLML